MKVQVGIVRVPSRFFDSIKPLSHHDILKELIPGIPRKIAKSNNSMQQIMSREVLDKHVAY